MTHIEYVDGGMTLRYHCLVWDSGRWVDVHPPNDIDGYMREMLKQEMRVTLRPIEGCPCPWCSPA